MQSVALEAEYYSEASSSALISVLSISVQFSVPESRLEPPADGPGSGGTTNEAIESLAEAIKLILQDRREDGLRGIPPNAVRDKVTVK